MTFNANAIPDEKEAPVLALKDESVQEWLDDILAEMAREFPDPKKGQKYASRIRLLFEHATREVKATKGKFSGFTRPVDAAQELLKEVGHPLDVEDLAKRLIEGGFTTKTEDPQADIRRSLGAYLPRAKNTRTALKRPAGKENLVGLGDWPDSRFE